MVYVAVLNEGVSREAEALHLQRLPGQRGLALEAFESNFLRLRLGGHSLKWERHVEFTRYTLVQAIPPQVAADAGDSQLLSHIAVDADWLRQIPGLTVCAVQLLMLEEDLRDAQAALSTARGWFGERTVVASGLGRGHSWAVTDFHPLESGFERMVVIAPAGTSPTRAGRISQSLLEIETYRLMALRGLPVAKGPCDHAARGGSGARRHHGYAGGQTFLRRRPAGHLDRTGGTGGTGHGGARLPLCGHASFRQAGKRTHRRVARGADPGIGEFMRRRLSPAIATVGATAQRLASLSQRIERAGALLRTRVDIATEQQHQLLLAKLSRGQELQLRLQSTVEGLSVAAIAYYVVSLLLYIAKAA